jgi:predicted lipoprotein with Yx(FWY)xxD motif
MRTRQIAGTGILLLLAACGGGGGAPAAQQSPPAEATSSAPATTAAPTAAGEATLAVASTSLGDVLVGSTGMTLYLYDPDKQGASTCYDQCAQAWPPLTVTGEPVAGEGVDASLLGVTERTDGSRQVTYNKWPLYYWVKDAKAGDATGQAVKGVWWVVDANGEPVRQ